MNGGIPSATAAKHSDAASAAKIAHQRMAVLRLISALMSCLV